ncbi:MAG: hypothetical protein HZB91_10740 [Elusimicrobia bacterium]|nr:hypothetical protein [Elusimicrobiota bacterium]
MKNRLLALLLGVFLSAIASARAYDLVPVAEFQALAGQLFTNGKPSNWQGNANLRVTPAVRLNDRWGVIPTYAASYQGVKSVTELAGGGQLFQDSMSHSLSVKGVYTSGPWRLKPSLSHRWDFLRETSKEGWGDGLFDFRKLASGVEASYTFSPKVKASGGFDFYRITFPNYRSLASLAPSGLGREQAEISTLDTLNYSWSAGAEIPLPIERSWAKLGLNVTQRDYPEQHIVSAAGVLTSRLRTDDMKSVSGLLGWGHPFSDKFSLALTMLGGFTRVESDQNHYDASLNIFSDNYYSYEERSFQPRVSLWFGKGEYSLSYLRVTRAYLGRKAQDSAGAYLKDMTSLEQDSFQFDLSVPILAGVKSGFKLIARAALTNSASNMRYEKLFRYNYTLTSHLVGFSYSY